MDDIQFTIGSVPVAIAAKVYGKDPAWVRAGIINGWLKIGYATKNFETVQELKKHKGRINYYISPRLLYQETGYLWKGERA